MARYIVPFLSEGTKVTLEEFPELDITYVRHKSYNNEIIITLLINKREINVSNFDANGARFFCVTFRGKSYAFQGQKRKEEGLEICLYVGT